MVVNVILIYRVRADDDLLRRQAHCGSSAANTMTP
jgi:hypothetical protein